jgi:hypothetical protein
MPADRSRYERLYLWARTRNPLIFSAGRLAMWCGRKMRRYPAWTVAYLALLAGLITLGFWPAVEPYGPLSWLAAGLVVIIGLVALTIGYAGFLVKYADHESQLRHLSTRRRLEGAEREIRRLRSDQRTTKNELESGHKRTRKALAKVGELDSKYKATDKALAQIGELGSVHQATRDALEAKIGDLGSEQKATKEALAKIGELVSGQDVLEAKLPKLEREQGANDALEAGISELRSEQQATKAAMEAKIGELKRQLATLDELSGAIEGLRREVTQASLVESSRRIHRGRHQ